MSILQLLVSTTRLHSCRSLSVASHPEFENSFLVPPVSKYGILYAAGSFHTGLYLQTSVNGMCDIMQIVLYSEPMTATTSQSKQLCVV